MARGDRFAFDDRVRWMNLNDGGFYETGFGTVTDVDNALEKLQVRWDNGDYGWAYMDELEHLDAITRLGDIVRDDG